MNDKEALQEYSKRFIYDGYRLEKWEINIIQKSLGFQRYLLAIRIEDLKQEIFNSLPKWLQIFLKGER